MKAGGQILRKAVFFDRDGVLNRAEIRGGKPYPPARLEDFTLLPGAAETVAAVRDAGYLAIVVTNQSDIAEGRQTPAALEEMHRRLQSLMPLDEIRVCSDRLSPCFKPKPGMLLEAADAWDIDLPASYMIGDRWRDVACGRAAGCFTIFIDYGYPETELADMPEPDIRVADILGARDVVLQRAARH